MTRTLITTAVVLSLSYGVSWSTIEVQGDNAFKTKVANTLTALKNNGNVPQKSVIEGLENSGNKHIIKKTNVKFGSTCTFETKKGSDGTGTGSTVEWEPEGTDKYDNDVDRDPKAALFHELVHASHADTGTAEKGVTGGIPKEEVTTTKTENLERVSKSKPQRTKYGNKALP